MAAGGAAGTRSAWLCGGCRVSCLRPAQRSLAAAELAGGACRALVAGVCGRVREEECGADPHRAVCAHAQSALSRLHAHRFWLRRGRWARVPAPAVGRAFRVDLHPTIRSEEAFLRSTFAEFDEYARRVPRLLPRLTPARFEDQTPSPAAPAAAQRRFSPERYRHHREYNASMGAAAIYAVLLLRLWLLH